MYNYLKISLLILLALNLSCCGFQMRSKNALPPKLQNVYLQSVNPYDQFTLSFKQVLKANGANIADKIDEASCILDITTINFSHSGANIYSSTQANIYTFNLVITFKVDATNGKNILPKRTISISRLLTLNPDEVIESSNQVQTLEREMHQEAILKILNILTSKQVTEELRKRSGSSLDIRHLSFPRKWESRIVQQGWIPAS